MMPSRTILAACATALALLPGTGQAADLALRCGALFEPDTGAVLGPHVIEVTGTTIEAVRAGEATEAKRVIDLSARTCTPGWIDLHTHLTFQVDAKMLETLVTTDPAESALRGAAYARRTLRAGFTTVRDVGDIDNSSIALREAIRNGMVEGPRIFTAGRALGATGGHADYTNGLATRFQGQQMPEAGIVDSPADGVRAVRQRYKDGADLIKVAVTAGVLSLERDAGAAHLEADEIAAIVETAHGRGMKVAAHAHGEEGVRRAVQAGVDTVEHATFVDDETLRAMKKRGTWMVPTAIAARVVGGHVAGNAGYPENVRRKAEEVGGRARDVVARAHRAGVRIAFGSDAGAIPHGMNAGEFMELVASGLTPAEALRAATVHAAAVLGESSRLGRIAPGYVADVVALDGDPLQDMALTLRPAFVMKAGEVALAAPQAP